MRVATAKPTEKENEEWAAAPGTGGREEKLSSPPPTPVLMPVPVYFVHSAVTCGVAKASPALHRHRGGPNFENAPALTAPPRPPYHHFIYIDGTNLTLRSAE
jgi:hypothetical protein